MYKKGHLGVSLLVFGPVGYTLVSNGYSLFAFVGGLFMLWFTMLPDIDHRLPILKHRGPTHSLLFAGVVGAIGWAVGTAAESVISSSFSLATFGFAIGSLTVLAHLLADTLTPAGVPYLWPLSGRTVSVSLANANSQIANSGLFGLGLLMTLGWVAVVSGWL